MRRAEKAMDLVNAVGILENGEYGVLSMNSPHNGAYGIPLNYAYHQGDLYVHCALEGRKIESIRTDNRVSFCVVGSSKVIPQRFTSAFESVVVSGRVFFCEGADKMRGLMALLKKYSPEHLEKGTAYAERDAKKTAVLRIEVLEITGKASR